MEAQKKYQLTFHFDSAQIAQNDLSIKVKKLIRKHLSAIEFNIADSNSGYWVLTIKGSLESIDSCHMLINDHLLKELSCIRVLDQAGDENRQRAYLTLSRIEQNLRVFVSHVMRDTVGSDWWDTWSSLEVQEKVQTRRRKAKTLEYHSIELIDFDDLIHLITESVQCWQTNKPILASDLQEILTESKTIDELKKSLEEMWF